MVQVHRKWNRRCRSVAQRLQTKGTEGKSTAGELVRNCIDQLSSIYTQVIYTVQYVRNIKKATKQVMHCEHEDSPARSARAAH